MIYIGRIMRERKRKMLNTLSAHNRNKERKNGEKKNEKRN